MFLDVQDLLRCLDSPALCAHVHTDPQYLQGFALTASDPTSHTFNAADIHLAVGRDLSLEEQDAADWQLQLVTSAVTRCDALFLGPLFLRKKRPSRAIDHDFWLMRRKDIPFELRQPRFGIFKEAYTHRSPDGHERIIVKVEMYEVADEVYHPTIRAPLASSRVDRRLSTFCFAKDIVPHQCFAMPDTAAVPAGGTPRFVMLTEDRWHVLPHLGFPAIPAMALVL